MIRWINGLALGKWRVKSEGWKAGNTETHIFRDGRDVWTGDARDFRDWRWKE
jgi:hypothetical protein